MARPERALTLRRWAFALITAASTVVIATAFGHRSSHMLPNLVLPGSGLLEESVPLGVLFIVGFFVSTLLWMQWGLDWLALAVVVTAVVLGGLLGFSGHHHEAVVAAHPMAHEFPIVVALLTAWAWLRSAISGLPLARRWAARRAQRLAGLADLRRLRPVDRCRTGAIAALAAAGSPDEEIGRAHV